MSSLSEADYGQKEEEDSQSLYSLTSCRRLEQARIDYKKSANFRRSRIQEFGKNVSFGVCEVPQSERETAPPSRDGLVAPKSIDLDEINRRINEVISGTFKFSPSPTPFPEETAEPDPWPDQMPSSPPPPSPTVHIEMTYTKKQVEALKAQLHAALKKAEMHEREADAARDLHVEAAQKHDIIVEKLNGEVSRLTSGAKRQEERRVAQEDAVRAVLKQLLAAIYREFRDFGTAMMNKVGEAEAKISNLSSSCTAIKNWQCYAQKRQKAALDDLQSKRNKIKDDLHATRRKLAEVVDCASELKQGLEDKGKEILQLKEKLRNSENFGKEMKRLLASKDIQFQKRIKELEDECVRLGKRTSIVDKELEALATARVKLEQEFQLKKELLKEEREKDQKRLSEVEEQKGRVEHECIRHEMEVKSERAKYANLSCTSKKQISDLEKALAAAREERDEMGASNEGLLAENTALAKRYKDNFELLDSRYQESHSEVEKLRKLNQDLQQNFEALQLEHRSMQSQLQSPMNGGSGAQGLRDRLRETHEALVAAEKRAEGESEARARVNRQLQRVEREKENLQKDYDAMREKLGGLQRRTSISSNSETSEKKCKILQTSPEIKPALTKMEQCGGASGQIPRPRDRCPEPTNGARMDNSLETPCFGFRAKKSKVCIPILGREGDSISSGSLSSSSRKYAWNLSFQD